MSKVLLDTNICIYIINNKPPKVRKKLESHQVGDIYLSSITIAELYYGAYKSKRKEQNLLALEHFITPFEIVDFDYQSALCYGKIRAELEKKGCVIGGMDMLIASCAMSINATLVSNNTQEFRRISGLKLENWAE